MCNWKQLFSPNYVLEAVRHFYKFLSWGLQKVLWIIVVNKTLGSDPFNCNYKKYKILRVCRKDYHGDFDWLIIYCCSSCSRIFQLDRDVTSPIEGLQNLDLTSARSIVKACNKEAEANFYGKLYLWRHIKTIILQVVKMNQ